MRIEHLEYFTKVVECGGITTASSKLFISPQGLSQAIKQLEKELDIDFFIRTPNGLSLTAAGQMLYDNSQKILAIDDFIHVSINQLKMASNSNSKQHINIYGTHMVNCTFIPQAITSFHKKFPYIVTCLSESDSKSVFDDADTRGAAITFFNLPEPVFNTVKQKFIGKLDFQILTSSPLEAIISKRSPLVNRKHLEIEEIIRHPLVLYVNDNMIMQDLFGIGLDSINITMTSSSVSTCRTLLASDDNAVGLSNSFSEQFLDHSSSLISKPILPEFNILYGYFLTCPDELPEEIHDFIKIVRNLANSNPSLK